MENTCAEFLELASIENDHRSNRDADGLPDVMILHAQCALDAQRVIRLHAKNCKACLTAYMERPDEPWATDNQDYLRRKSL